MIRYQESEMVHLAPSGNRAVGERPRLAPKRRRNGDRTSRKTLYEVLGVRRGVTLRQLQEAFVERRRTAVDDRTIRELKAAYLTLASPERRRSYDADLALRGPVFAGSRLRIPMPALLGALLLAGVLTVRGSVWPMLAWRFQAYAAGTDLVRRDGVEPYGQVVGYEGAHRFPNGAIADAYRIRLHGSETEAWRTREEVNKLTRPWTSRAGG